MDKNLGKVGAPQENTNAEKWNLEEATNFFNKALELSKEDDYDFIGEVAKDLDQNKGVFDYLINKYPDGAFTKLKSHIKSNCETNCFRNAKRGNITASIALANLKSNHNWTDRVETNNTNTVLEMKPITKEELEARKKEIEERY